MDEAIKKLYGLWTLEELKRSYEDEYDKCTCEETTILAKKVTGNICIIDTDNEWCIELGDTR